MGKSTTLGGPVRMNAFVKDVCERICDFRTQAKTDRSERVICDSSGRGTKNV
jgi:hypothetical protein